METKTRNKFLQSIGVVAVCALNSNICFIYTVYLSFVVASTYKCVSLALCVCTNFFYIYFMIILYLLPVWTSMLASTFRRSTISCNWLLYNIYCECARHVCVPWVYMIASNFTISFLFLLLPIYLFFSPFSLCSNSNELITSAGHTQKTNIFELFNTPHGFGPKRLDLFHSKVIVVLVLNGCNSGKSFWTQHKKTDTNIGFCSVFEIDAILRVTD